MRIRWLLMALVALVLSLGVAACGGDDDEGDGGGEAVEAPATTGEDTGADTGGGGDAVEVSADPDGALRFEQDSLTAPAGSVTFEFTNEASVPHDFDIEDSNGEDVAGTDPITGDSETLRTDLEAGRYTYYCSVDGHRQAGMEGTLEVE